ncbi:C45 family autoproteolytic acyltransferase/hydrolase [Plantactinospora sp. WMMC1484]|uniref:C45 family autoproteolytic acyltransferase/hydolase n=1 Tax=Plantactinospora sp. WMMC1484 TaxID=3404122 RepID=UPI003BF605AD
MSQSHSFPHYRVGGPPRERGRAYGALARREIESSMVGYARVFDHYQGWAWPEVQRRARGFLPVIADFSPAIADELAGIAEGANLDFEDVVALNTRSEMMFGDGTSIAPLECTSFCLTPEATRTRTLIAGQNWDWIQHARQTSVVLEVHRDDGPDFMTVVEAGLLAKVGFNSAGVGLCTNTLISSHSEGTAAVPYHVLLRSVLDSDSGRQAADRIVDTDRAISANYLIFDRDGFCTDIETTPVAGGFQRLSPTDGVLTHANHFLADDLTERDVYLARKKHTVDRLRAIDQHLRDRHDHTIESLKATLADHTFEPNSVCQHLNPDVPEPERTCTIAGIIIDVEDAALHVAPGNPCTTSWLTYHIGT